MCQLQAGKGCSAACLCAVGAWPRGGQDGGVGPGGAWRAIGRGGGPLCGGEGTLHAVQAEGGRGSQRRVGSGLAEAAGRGVGHGCIGAGGAGGAGNGCQGIIAGQTDALGHGKGEGEGEGIGGAGKGLGRASRAIKALRALRAGLGFLQEAWIAAAGRGRVLALWRGGVAWACRYGGIARTVIVGRADQARGAGRGLVGIEAWHADALGLPLREGLREGFAGAGNAAEASLVDGAQLAARCRHCAIACGSIVGHVSRQARALVLRGAVGRAAAVGRARILNSVPRTPRALRARAAGLLARGPRKADAVGIERRVGILGLAHGPARDGQRFSACVIRQSPATVKRGLKSLHLDSNTARRQGTTGSPRAGSSCNSQRCRSSS